MNHAEDSDTIYRLAGDVHARERQIIDFSLPVNPLGVSKKVKAEVRKHLKYLNRYPDPETTRIRKRLGQFHAIDPEMIICGNGSTELLYLIARAFSPQKLLLPMPTSPGYEEAYRMSGTADIIKYGLKREQHFDVTPDAFIQAITERLCKTSTRSAPGNYADIGVTSEPVSMVLLCNPNDITGRSIEKRSVQKIADAARDLQCYLVVDEAHIDFDLSHSMIEEAADNPYLIVLRSMSYAYGLAGIRFGYAVCSPFCIARLRECKVPWTVNSLAQRAAAAALKDEAYRKESVNLIKREKDFLEKSFMKLGIPFIPSDVNFYLLHTAAASEICYRLRCRGILVRDFSGFPGLEGSHLGIAVKSHRENAILIRILAGILPLGG